MHPSRVVAVAVVGKPAVRRLVVAVTYEISVVVVVVNVVNVVVVVVVLILIKVAEMTSYDKL